MKLGLRIATSITTAALLGSTHLLAAQSLTDPFDAPTGVRSVASGASSSSDTGEAAQTGSMPSPRYNGVITPRVELFFGYSYLRAVPTLSSGNRLVYLNGGSASVAFNLNHFFGLVADVGGFDNSELRLSGPGANPPFVVGSEGKVYTYLFGPRFSYRHSERFTPFAQVLAGGIHASPVQISFGCTVPSCTPLLAQNAFALTAGGGLDITLQRHLALRLVQAEYLMTRFADTTTGNKTMQNDIRLSTGLVLRFGGGPPPPPVAYSCSAAPSSVYPGDPITVTGTALNLNPKRTPTYTWRSDGGQITGNSSTANIDTSKTAPGNYTAQGNVSEGLKPGHFADCSAPYTVMAFQPPTISCSASPSTLAPGESATITAQATSPQNRPLTYSYAASAGSINGTNSTATLNTSGSASGPITVTCTVVDDKGQTASSTTTVSVQTPPPPPAAATQNLCSVSFERDSRRPARVDNEGKACLDDVALTLQRSSDAKITLVGKGKPDLASRRATNVRQYLVTEKGIDPSRVSVYTGDSEDKTVDIILIPSGATMDTTALHPITP
jgi:hypothetical protein